MKSTTTTRTWADGFGVWHAVVSDPKGWGNAGERNIDRHWSNIRRNARRAIRRELKARGGSLTLSDGYAVRLEVVRVNDPTGTGVVFSVEFKEAP